MRFSTRVLWRNMPPIPSVPRSLQRSHYATDRQVWSDLNGWRILQAACDRADRIILGCLFFSQIATS
jgi:hypothetical protein